MRAGSEARMQGRGRSLRWAPVVKDRSCGSVEPQGTPPPEPFGEDDFPAFGRSCGSSGADDRGRSEHHSGGVSSSGALAREPSAGSERSAFTEAPGDSEAIDEETSAVAEHDAKDAPSAVAEAEFEDDRPPMRARGWRKEARNTDPPAVAGEEKPRLKNATFTDREDVGNIGYFFGNWGAANKTNGRRGTKKYRRPNQKKTPRSLA